MQRPRTCPTNVPTDQRFSRERAAGYDRQVIYNTRVVLAGCGALGQFLALLCALIGYRDVIFVDMDDFEPSNQTRSPFYRSGQSKAKATAVGARRLCTAPGRIAYRYGSTMVQRLGDAIFTGAQRVIVLAAVDSQPARLWLAQRCRLLGIPLVEGGFHGERWNLSVFDNSADDQPCWACGQKTVETARIFSCDAYARAAIAAGIVPATAPGAMVLAAWQLGAATALLHNDTTLANATVFGDLRQGTTKLMRRTADSDCRLDHRIHSRDAVELDLDPDSTVAALLQHVASLADDPVIHLPATFIHAAPCATCHQPSLVDQPEWAIAGTPVCNNCGGIYERRSDLIPEQHGSLASATAESLAELPLSQLGLGPGLHLRVDGRDNSLTIRLGGDGEALLTSTSHVNRSNRRKPRTTSAQRRAG